MPVFAPDAKSQWLELDTELQELLLDEMEKLAANPPRNHRNSQSYDIVVERGSDQHWVFFQFALNNRDEILVVTGVQHFVRRRLSS